MWSMGSEMKGSRLARLPGIATGTANRGHPVPEEPAGVLANCCCHEGSSGKPARRPTGVGSDLDKGCSRSPNVSGHSNTGRPASESLKGRHSIAHGAAPPVASRPGAGTLGRWGPNRDALKGRNKDRSRPRLFPGVNPNSPAISSGPRAEMRPVEPVQPSDAQERTPIVERTCRCGRLPHTE